MTVQPTVFVFFAILHVLYVHVSLFIRVSLFGIMNGFTALNNATVASAIATANASVCPFVCPSHSSIVSKRGNAEGCGLHRRVAQCF